MVYLRRIVERFPKPLAHLSGAHGGVGLIQDSEKGALSLFFVQGFRNFEIADRRLVQSHVGTDFILIDAGQVLQGLFLGFQKIPEERPQRRHRALPEIKPESCQGNTVKLRFDQFFAGLFREIRISRHVDIRSGYVFYFIDRIFF